MSRIAHELRYAARGLAKSPLFTSVAVLSLGLALALNTTMFAVADAVVHPYVPYPDASRLFVPRLRGGDPKRWPSFEERFQAIRDGMRSYDAIASYTMVDALVETPDVAEDRTLFAVSPTFFALLGVRPLTGRVLGVADSGATVTRSTVISLRLWNRLFHSRPLSERLTIDLGRTRYAIVGVMPRGAHFPYQADIWIPHDLAATDFQGRRWGPSPLLHLRSDVSLGLARRELDIVAARITAQLSPQRPISGWGETLEERMPQFQAQLSVPSFLAGSVLMVLVIACANLGTMMLARGIARRRETAIRIALGATSLDVGRAVLAECLLIGGAGMALGTLLTAWTIYALPHFVVPLVPAIGDLQPSPSWRVFVFAFVASAGTTLLAGMLPSFHAARTDPAEPMKEGAGTTARMRDRYNPLIILEVALSTALLMTAALFLVIVVRLAAFNFRYAAKRLLVAGIAPPKKMIPSEKLGAFYDGLVEHTRQLPHVAGVATLSSRRPYDGVLYAEQGKSGETWMNLNEYSVVSPTFLETSGISIVRGRDFAPGDATGPAPVVIVDEGAAARLWPDIRNPVGRMIKLGNKTSAAAWLRVVGVAAGLEYGPRRDANLPPDPHVYVVVPGDSARTRQLIVQGDGVGGDRGRAALAVHVRRAIDDVWPNAFADVRPWLDGYESTRAMNAFMASVFGAFAAFGLILCAVGLYGVLAYAVSRRLRELAVRIALGARRRDVVRLVVHDAAVTALAGVGIGAFVALTLTHSLTDAVSGIDYAYVVALVLAEAVLFGAAFLAALGPVRQAAKADPVEILRAI